MIGGQTFACRREILSKLKRMFGHLLDKKVVNNDITWSLWQKENEIRIVLIRYFRFIHDGTVFWKYTAYTEEDHFYHYDCPASFLSRAPVRHARWRDEISNVQWRKPDSSLSSMPMLSFLLLYGNDHALSTSPPRG